MVIHIDLDLNPKIVGIFNPGECAGFMKGKNQIGIFNLKNST